jgi:hypothetical protein
MGRAGYDLSVNKIGYVPERPTAAQPPTAEQVAAAQAKMDEAKKKKHERPDWAKKALEDARNALVEKMKSA